MLRPGKRLSEPEREDLSAQYQDTLHRTSTCPRVQFCCLVSQGNRETDVVGRGGGGQRTGSKSTNRYRARGMPGTGKRAVQGTKVQTKKKAEKEWCSAGKQVVERSKNRSASDSRCSARLLRKSIKVMGAVRIGANPQWHSRFVKVFNAETFLEFLHQLFRTPWR